MFILISAIISAQLLAIFEPSKDSKVALAQPTANFGKAKYMMVSDKINAADRSYLEFNMSGSGLSNINDAELRVWVYQTGKNAVGSEIQAWYCANVTFHELTINWKNQPARWHKNGSHLSKNCTLADSYIIANKVSDGLPEAFHSWDLTAAVNDALSNDNLFTIALKHDTESSPNNFQYVQYLTRNYTEAAFRPQLVIS